MQDVIKFLKVRDVESPNRSYKYDAGIDFFVPKFNKLFIKDLKAKNNSLFDESTTYGVGLGNGEVTAYGTYDGNSLSMSGSSGSTVTISGNTEARINYDLNDYNDTKIRFDEDEGLNYFLLPPHARIMIPAGIKSRMSKPGRALIAANKSGVATKHGLVFGAQVVDYSYTGEIHISVINTSTKVVRIYEDMKLIQFLETPVYFSEVKILDGVNTPAAVGFYTGMTIDRGEGGFGSTDNPAGDTKVTNPIDEDIKPKK